MIINYFGNSSLRSIYQKKSHDRENLSKNKLSENAKIIIREI